MSNTDLPTETVTSEDHAMSRRGLLAKAGIGGLTAAGLAAAFGSTGLLSRSARGETPPNPRPPIPGSATDVAVFQFALQLEYLEAEYYRRAVGFGGVPDSGDAPVIGGREVPFQSQVIREYAEEIARDEFNHVCILKESLRGDSTPRPPIDFTNAFTAAARAAGIVGPNEEFDAFANETNFLFGAYLFEDVGVTAYRGAAPLLTNPRILSYAAGILAVEGYHAGEVRTLLVGRAPNPLQNTDPIIFTANKISNARDRLDGPGGKDQGLSRFNRINIVPTDARGLAFARTPGEVLNIVYLTPGNGVTEGGFFPEGVNGAIQST